MGFKKLVAEHNDIKILIEEDYPEVGVYMYFYNKEGVCFRDDLQNNIQICKEIAYREFDVSLDKWK